MTGSTGAAGIRLDLEGPVATVTLCRPAVLNAQHPQMWRALRDIGRELPGDIRVAILRGEGRAFSAGLDLAVVSGSGVGSVAGESGVAGDAGVASDGNGGVFAELVKASPADAEARISVFQEAFSWLRRPSLISIAAVHGHAIGAGFQLAIACDFRVVADDAKFSMAEVKLGLVPDLGGTKRLVELVGYARALELCVTGRRVAADEASQIGLANIVVRPDELDAAVRDLVAAVLAGARDAVVEIKALVAAAAGRPFAEQEAAERAAQVRRLRDLAGLGD